MVSWVQLRTPKNQAAVVSVVKSVISMARKGQISSLRCEQNGHCFCWQQCYALWIFFPPQKQTINQHYFIDTLQHLWKNVQQKSPQKRNLEDRLLHDDNAHARSTLSVCELTAKNKIIVISHPLYSWSLAPCDYIPGAQGVINREET